MRHLILILFLSLSKMVLAIETDTIINLRKTGPEINHEKSLDKSQSENNITVTKKIYSLTPKPYDASFSIDLLNLFAKQVLTTLEIITSSNNSSVVLTSGFSTNLNNYKIKVPQNPTEKALRKNIFGIGYRGYFMSKEKKTGFYIQPGVYFGQFLFEDSSTKNNQTSFYKSGAINIGYNTIKKSGAFIGFDIGYGLLETKKIELLYGWLRTGVEIGVAF